MTWEWFLSLRSWAQTVADAEGAVVCLVGSVLRKPIPRDIDVSIVLPLAEFERRFRAIPTDEQALNAYLGGACREAAVPHYVAAQKVIGYQTTVDVKFAPDTWWAEKDRLVIATPVTRKRCMSCDGNNVNASCACSGA